MYMALFDIKDTRNYIILKFRVITHADPFQSRITREFLRSLNLHAYMVRVYIHCDLPLAEISEWNNGESRTGLQKITEFDYDIVSF